MTLSLLILSIAVPIVFGYWVLMSILGRHPKEPILFRLAVSFGLGFGLLAQWMLVMGIVKIPYSLELVALPIVFTTIALFTICFFRKTRPADTFSDNFGEKSFKKFNILEYLMGGFIVLNVVYVFLMALNIPFAGWDVLATASFKAKIIYFERSLEFLRNFPCFSYPLYNSFCEVWISLMTGAWSEQIVKVIFPLTLSAFLVTQYYFLKQFVDRSWALFGLVLLVSSNLFTFHSAFAYRDIPISFYSCSSLMFLILWRKKQNDAWVLLAALFSGFASFLKTEGLIHAAVLFFIFLVILLLDTSFCLREKIKKFFKYSIPNFLICSLYPLYVLLAVAEPEGGRGFNIHRLSFSTSVINFSRVWVIFTRVLEDFFLLGNWNVVWVGLLLTLFMLKRHNFTFEIKILLLYLISFLLIVIFGFSFSSFYVKVANHYSILSRCILQFFPIAPMLIVLIHGRRDCKEIFRK